MERILPRTGACEVAGGLCGRSSGASRSSTDANSVPASRPTLASCSRSPFREQCRQYALHTLERRRSLHRQVKLFVLARRALSRARLPPPLSRAFRTGQISGVLSTSTRAWAALELLPNYRGTETWLRLLIRATGYRTTRLRWQLTPRVIRTRSIPSTTDGRPSGAMPEINTVRRWMASATSRSTRPVIRAIRLPVTLTAGERESPLKPGTLPRDLRDRATFRAPT